MKFTRLRISGFKSFIDPTEFWIEPGLTGIVGPNGCGKSNLVEALRWVMGETSAKQMRGGEMDDVIFSGTAGRPARNIAEVTLQLDNGNRRAPTPFNDSEDIEVGRRIERGAGSSYHINGREVRARDVQILFADAATGARSTALVSQGHIGDLINSKPIQRRGILEEAAGITGLHSRRHEAELRLRAADTNLERLDDVLATLDAQLVSLKRQARQAARYRKIGDHIRRAESIALHMRWSEATAALEAARERLGKADSTVTGLTRRTGAAAAKQAEAAAGLPEMRRAEGQAATALQRLVMERERLEAEEARLAQARRDCDRRVDQTEGDIEREKTLAGDAAAALTRIGEEATAIAIAQADEEGSLQAAADQVTAALAEVTALERELTTLTGQVAADEARRTALEGRIGECEGRRARLVERVGDIARELGEVAGGGRDEAALAAAETAAAEAEARLDELRAAVETAEQALARAQGAENTERDALRDAEAEHARLHAEAAALTEVLNANGCGDLPPIIDEVTVDPGLEIALGAALGDDLAAPADEEAPLRWEALPEAGAPASLPAGAEPLNRFVKAPAALARRLSQIGVVPDKATGLSLRAQMSQGQRLVTRDGALWRWDGFCIEAGAPTPAAARLGQRNRLAEVRENLSDADGRLEESRSRYDAARQAAGAAAAAVKQAQEAARRGQGELDAARAAYTEIAREVAAHDSRLAALRDAEERLAAELAETESELEQARAALDSAPGAEAGREAADGLRQRLSGRRDLLIECQSSNDRLVREAAGHAERLGALAAERQSWQARADSAAHQLEELEERLAAAKAERQTLAERPDKIASERRRLLDLVEAAERERSRAGDALAQAEARLGEADRELKQEETCLAEAREGRVRAEAQVEQAEQGCEVVAERVLERLGCKPEAALDAGGVGRDAELPDMETVTKRLERLQRERDNMGPVNLRAETEACQVDEQIETLRSERADLMSAISRLRQGIASLNREGRERLLAAFGQVDQRFQELFTRLFGGGRAHMRLTEADDPLEAGLEIFASPPGKRLQVLSLLSGGEQALTALALLFAVFLTNPAPVCVLDEVDAALDDANVDRFCMLIEEIARSSDTRFLIVTHHRMTMARMDRLFGVTMADRGISQLVSVDLEHAERLRATA
ncbi:MAG: chromosome segregation protein SMC [Alphaproteobacteria bacterium]